MRIKCLYNEGIFLPDDSFEQKNSEYKSITYSLKINKDYVVYAITLRNKYLWYYICDENFTYYPRWQPSPLFEVIDNRLSRYWVFSYKKSIDYIKPIAIFGYPEWAENMDYYDKLTDGYETEVSIFKSYKKKMDLEFPDPSITAIAQIGDDEWLICPNCIDAWQSDDDQSALVKCPNCKEILNNPRYKNL